ncbi:stabilizer of axonemal microtubules 2 [Bombina bombina]|uniref:stabilizer of axonemal microtubules 2 n=1 Tax=Bombina bombina TaxID=8345 RepID=UPI00235ADEAF|nr:stabilizer of axonemal microtubules 2 [Bombina bombina]
MKLKCICEICTCGRHRCPHMPTKIFEKSGKPCVLTEYVEKYPQYDNFQPTKSLKPNQEYRGNHGKMEGITTFKSDFIPYDVVGRPVRPHAEYQPKPGNIDLGTTYNKDYNPYKIQPMAPVRPVERRPTYVGKFDTNPTYKDDFRAWDMQKRELAKHDNAYQPPTGKFGNSTTFQDDYFPKELMPRESYKPSNIAKHSDIPFDGTTSHRTSYVPYDIVPRFARQKEQFKPSSQPFEDLTTHRLNFKGVLGELTKSYKPEHGKVGSSAKFEGSTEFKDSFQPWSVNMPHVHKSQEYIPPTTHMELDTTTHLDYVPHQLGFIAPIRPVSHGRRSNAPFQGNSTMKDDFRAWETGRQEMIKKDHQIPKPTGKFNGLTTFKSHYQPHEIHLTQSFKPSNAALRSSAPFESGTLYRSDFTPKANEICPANYPSPPGYVFENIDTRGHKIFRKMLTPGMNVFSKLNEDNLAKAIAVIS